MCDAGCRNKILVFRQNDQKIHYSFFSSANKFDSYLKENSGQ